MKQETFNDILLPMLVLTALFFFYRKVYYHFKVRQLYYPDLNNISILGLVLFHPLTLLGHLYIMSPFYLRSGKDKKDEEIKLETKIVNSLWTFWILFWLTIIVGLLVNLPVPQGN